MMPFLSKTCTYFGAAVALSSGHFVKRPQYKTWIPATFMYNRRIRTNGFDTKRESILF
jgi:hypothetical protein